MADLRLNDFLQQKRESCQREIARIRGLGKTLDQVRTYEFQLLDVLKWQELGASYKDHVFTFQSRSKNYLIVFWPVDQESIDNSEKLGTEGIESLLSNNPSAIVLPASLVGFNESLIESARRSNGRILLVDGLDIDALCSLDWYFDEMIDFKQRQMELFGQPNVDYLSYSASRSKTQYVESLLVPLEDWLEKGLETEAQMFRDDVRARWIDFDKGLIVEWPELSMAESFAVDSKLSEEALIVGGAPGSGKSTFLYAVGHRCASQAQAPVRYFNLANLRDENIEAVIEQAKALPRNAVILFDDLHQKADLANKVIGAILGGNMGVKVIAATRPSYFSQVQEKLGGGFGWRDFQVKRIDLQSRNIVDQVIEQYSRKMKIKLQKGATQVVKAQVGQDLTVLGWGLRNFGADVTRVDTDFADALVKYRFTPLLSAVDRGVAALGVLYIITFFEQCDVKIANDFVLSFGFQKDLLDNLDALGYIDVKQVGLGVGHANLARLYVRTLDKRLDLNWFQALADRINQTTGTRPADLENMKIALLDSYFRRRDVAARGLAMKNVFEYLSPSRLVSPLHQDMIHMVRAVERAMSLLIQYFQRDPTGEHSVSNSAMMCQVFTKLGRMDLARQALEFISAQQVMVHGETSAEFIQDINRDTTIKDFQSIRSATEEEDEHPDPATTELLGQLSDVITDRRPLSKRTDFDKFRQTWLSATVLPPIELVLGKQHQRFAQTLRTVQDNQDKKLGGFYPLDFCWSTARCVINLANVGLSLESSEIAGGVEWLLRLQLGDGRWHSPDSKWNPDIEITAVCLQAILRGGISPKHPAVQSALKWLLSKQEDGYWNKNPHDTSHVVEALNDLNWSFDELRAALRFIEHRVSTDEWYQTVVGKERRQSLEIGELANVLLEIQTKYLFGYVRDTIGTN